MKTLEEQIRKEQRDLDINRTKIFLETAFPNSPLIVKAYLEYMEVLNLV